MDCSRRRKRCSRQVVWKHLKVFFRAGSCLCDVNVDIGKVCADSILAVGCDEDVKTKWEFERAQLLATGATTKGLSESHAGLRTNPAAVQSTEPCVPGSLWSFCHSSDALAAEGLSSPPWICVWASSHTFTALCSNGPFLCEHQSLLKIRTMEQVGSCSEGSEPWQCQLCPVGRDWHPAGPHSKFLSLVPACSPIMTTPESKTKVSKHWCEGNWFHRQKLATNTLIFFLEFANFLLCISVVHKKYYLQYKVVATFFLCFIFSAIFSS